MSTWLVSFVLSCHRLHIWSHITYVDSYVQSNHLQDVPGKWIDCHSITPKTWQCSCTVDLLMRKFLKLYTRNVCRYCYRPMGYRGLPAQQGRSELIRFCYKSLFSERELFAICYRPSVRLSVCLSVTFLRPTQAVQIFGNISTALGILATHWHPLKISRRSSQGNPSAGGVKHKRGSQV